MTKRLSLTLVNKLVLAFVILILVQVLSLTLMNWFLERTEMMVEREHHQEDLIEALDGLFAERLGSYFFLLNAPKTKNATLEANQLRNKQRAMESLDRAKKLLQEQDGAAREVIQNIEQSYLEEEKRKQQIESSEYELQKFGRLAAVLMRMKHLREQMSEPIQARNEARDQRLTAQKQLKLALFTVVALNILLALGIVLTLIRRVRQSLFELKKNALAMQGLNDLPYSIESHDELGLLDQALHTAHIDLVRARQHRVSVNQMIAHDIRSPIMSVEWLLQSIADAKNYDDASLQKKISTVRSNVRRIHNHVEDLLTIEKSDSGNIELNFSEFDIAVLIEEICAESLASANARSLTIQNESKSCRIIADYERIWQAITNYVSNAIKYADENSVIVISTENTAEQVCVRVTNSGPTIERIDQRKVFDRFFRASASRNVPGFGIGLANCKLIVELHGGEVGLTSKANKTTFWLRLPIE